MHITEIIRDRLGWCPHARVLTTSQQGIPDQLFDNPAMLPDGGSPGPGRIGRGKDIAIESMKMLVRNRRLLWFSFLIFLTFAISIAADPYIRIISGTNAFPGVINSAAILRTAVTFTAAFLEIFVFLSLAAGLIICVAPIPRGNPITIREGLLRAWQHKRAIAGWTIVGALLWVAAGVFACGFYLITVFALPAIVLGNKDLPAAIRESIPVFGRLWVETYVSFGIILLMTMGLVVVTLFCLGQAAFAYGLIEGGIIAGMIALLISVIMAVGLVIMGIATCSLYTYEKAGVPLDR